ncbi:MAG TPA: RHS repeat-associated core domain-containing protein, partial [Polyangiaceae bacterium]
SETAYDDWGNATRVKGVNGRCTDLVYHEAFKQFPTSETVYREANCKPESALVMGASTYDRGLGLVTLAVDLNSQPTKVGYDGFGRTAALWKPSPTDAGELSPKASVKIEYFLPPTLGNSVSAIHTQTEDGANPEDTNEYLESWAFVDGFGRTRTTLSEADPDNDSGDGAQWIVSGLVTHDAKGAVQRKHIEYFYDGDPSSFATTDLAAAPPTPYGSQRYDAFGRAVQTFDLDGTMTLRTVYRGLGTDLWDAADLSTGPHAGTYASERKDGHGRSIRATEKVHSGASIQTRHVLTSYSPTGQPEVITRRLSNNSANDVTRWMRYDSLGRMVMNYDPHTSSALATPPDPTIALSTYVKPTGLRTWIYNYNYAGDLIGTEDARGTGSASGCGVNFAYDALGRLLGEDYVPCDSTHQAYSAPDSNFTSGWEVVYYYDGPPTTGDQVPTALGTHQFNSGRLVTVRDRAAETTTFVDGRGRVVSTVRRVGSPADAAETVNNTVASRYTPQWFYKWAAYDAADRVVAETIGGQHTNAQASFDGASVDVFGTDPQDRQAVRTEYTKRGTVKGVGGSYGTLVAKIKRRPDGLVTNLVYGDSAGTQTATTYDDRRRPTSIQTFRAGSPFWSAFATGGSGMSGITYSPVPSVAGTPTNFQMLLEDTDIAYDEVGNPVELRDWREPSEWPASNKPATKKIEYDDLYRVRRMDYLYATSTGMDSWQSPFERENGETDSERNMRRARPAPQLVFTNRPLWQRFEYDWLGNLSESDDDAHGFYDRSIGTQAHSNSGKPYQLSGANNTTQAASSGYKGNVTTVYDAAGNLTRLSVVRPNTTGACTPSGAGCTQLYAYSWDEVGRLVKAQRWDSTSQAGTQLATDTPSGTAAYELRYRYDAGDQRVIKRLYRDTMSSQRQSLYVFGSLEAHRTSYSSTNGTYAIDNATLVPYPMANGIRLARLHYEAATTNVPQVAGAGLTDALGATNTAATLHVLLELGDHLGSTGTVLDKVSSELVERTGYLPFGARENDYRPSRWNGFREDYGFTGKEEDVQVGLTYFGKRYLSAQLGRWISPDPLGVHAPGKADFNLYAYVSGAVLKAVDPVGLDTAWIVFKGGDDYHSAVLTFAAKWEKRGDDRHVIVVNASPSPKELEKAWKKASEAAGKGGRVVLTGHGTEENETSSWGVQLAAAKPGAKNDFKINVQDLKRVESVPTERLGDRERTISSYFSTARESLERSGVKDVELFGCNIGKNREQLETIGRQFGTRTTAYNAYSGAADDGSTTSLSKKKDAPPIQGTVSEGLPSETEVGAGYTTTVDPHASKTRNVENEVEPGAAGRAAGEAGYKAGLHAGPS